MNLGKQFSFAIINLPDSLTVEVEEDKHGKPYLILIRERNNWQGKPTKKRFFLSLDDAWSLMVTFGAMFEQPWIKQPWGPHGA